MAFVLLGLSVTAAAFAAWLPAATFGLGVLVVAGRAALECATAMASIQRGVERDTGRSDHVLLQPPHRGFGRKREL